MNTAPPSYLGLSPNQITLLAKVEAAANSDAGFDPRSVKPYWVPSYRALLKKGMVAQAMSGCRATVTEAGRAKLAALRGIMAGVGEGSAA